MSDNLVHGQLFGHGELRLSSRPMDYGNVRVYLGSISSSKMSSVKEETYQIAHSLGASSNPQVVANVDYRTVGLLLNPSVANFADACFGSFSAPKVERDHLSVPNSSLTDAVNFHAASVSGWVLTCIHFVSFSLLDNSFMCRF